MQFIVIIPFALVALAVLLACTTAVAAANAAIDVAATMLPMVLTFLKFLLGLVCFGGGLYLIGAGSYRLATSIRKRLSEPVYASWHFLWIAFGLFLFSYGFANLFSKAFTRNVPYEQVWYSTKWFFWSEKHSEIIRRPVPTVWLDVSKFLKTTGTWLLIAAVLCLVVEFVLRKRREPSRTV